MKKTLLSLLCLFTIKFSFSQDTIKQLQEVSISASRAEAQNPIVQTTIQKEEIRKSFFGQDPAILLSTTPSVYYYSDGGNYSGYMYMRLRGIDQTRINFTLNGVPLSEPEDQGTYFSNYTDFLNNISSVQVQRGVGTSKNGTASFGGSVDFNSTNLLDSSYTHIQAGTGSFNSGKISVGTNTGMLKNKTSFYTRFSKNQSDGYRYHSGTNANNFFFSGGYFGDNDILKITAFIGNSKNEMAYTAVSLSDLKLDPRTNYLTKDENDDFTQSFIQLQHTKKINSNNHITSSIYKIALQGNYDVLFVSDMYNFKLKSDMYGFTSVYNFYKNKTKINAGIHINNYYRDHSAFIKPDISNELYLNRGTKQESSAFANINYNICKGLSLFSDIQVKTVNFDYTPNIKTFNHAISPIRWNFFNPKVGFNYKFNDKINTYAFVGQTHREPTRNDMFAGFDDIDSTNYEFIGTFSRVKPESVIDYEIGTNFNYKKIKIKTNVFYMDFKNEIAAIGKLSYIGLPLRKNVDESYRTGMELEYEYIPFVGLKLFGNATYMQAKIKEYTTDYDSITYKNVSPLLTPNLMFTQGIELYSKDFSLGVSGRYISSSFLENSNDVFLIVPENFILNAYANFKINKHMNCTFNVNNITNETYYNSGYAVGTTPYYFIGATRNFFFTLNITF